VGASCTSSQSPRSSDSVSRVQPKRALPPPLGEMLFKAFPESLTLAHRQRLFASMVRFKADQLTDTDHIRQEDPIYHALVPKLWLNFRLRRIRYFRRPNQPPVLFSQKGDLDLPFVFYLLLLAPASHCPARRVHARHQNSGQERLQLTRLGRDHAPFSPLPCTDALCSRSSAVRQAHLYRRSTALSSSAYSAMVGSAHRVAVRWFVKANFIALCLPAVKYFA